jgi:hypothetical protein
VILEADSRGRLSHLSQDWRWTRWYGLFGSFERRSLATPLELPSNRLPVVVEIKTHQSKHSLLSWPGCNVVFESVVALITIVFSITFSSLSNRILSAPSAVSRSRR